MPWSHSPHWQEIIDEQMNDELLFSTLKQRYAKVQSVILRPNEINWEKRQLYQQLVKKSVNIFNQLKDKKKTKPMVGITRISFPKTDAKWEMIKQLHLFYEVKQDTVYLQFYQLIDSGAKSNHLSPEIVSCFSPKPSLEEK